MQNKKVARIDIVKAVAGVSFATLAAVGSTTGNPVVAGLSAIPAAGLASYEAVGDQLSLLKRQKEKPLEIPVPPWWQHDSRSWQNLCAEIGNCLPQILEEMRSRMQQEQQVITTDVARQIFIDALASQRLTWEQDDAQKRRVGELLAIPILQKLEGLTSEIKHLQQEGALLDKRRTAQNTEQTVRVLEKIHAELSNILPALNDEELTTLHKQYSNTLYERWKMLDFRGIMHVDMNRSISIPLTEVFVFPDVLVGVPAYETIEREGEHFLYGGQQKSRRITPQREPLHTALGRHRRLVLLGDPGSGKSTLLRYLLLQLVQGSDAFAAAFPEMPEIGRAVPLYMPLATYAEVLLTNAPGNRSFEDFLPIHLRDNYLDAYVDFILAQLQQGNLLLLFDGLDEIPDASLRLNVVRHIEMFTQSHAANRFIVTSRIVGYKEAPLACEYQAYTLADFSEEQVKSFTQKWCPAYERWVNGASDSQYLEGAATKEAEKLFSATQSKPAVKRLAVNPLLLTILALIQRQGIDLPSHRIELFHRCAETLIDTWVRARGQSTHFSKTDLIKILRPLAFWMHEQSAVGAIPEEDLHERIVQQLRARGINEYEATKTAGQFLQTVRGKTGILVERGKERYGFLHLTFEEYFAARELEKRKDRDAFIRKHLHDPRWREVILLTVGSIGILQSDEEEVTDLVENTIVRAGSPYEWALHRDLFFAGQCLADDVGVSVSCENEIVEQTVYHYLTSPYDKLRDTCSNVLTGWSGMKTAEKATRLALPILQQWVTAGDEKKAFAATSPFEKKLAGHIEGLIAQHQDVMTRNLRFHLTIILACLQALDGVDWQGNLLGIASEDSVREKMARAFEQCQDRRSAIIDALLIALSDPDDYVRWNATLALGQLSDVQPRVIDALLIGLSDSTFRVRKMSATALGQLGNTEPRVIDALFDSMLDVPAVKEAAISSLGLLGKGQPHVIEALLNAYKDIDSSSVSNAARDALERLRLEYPQVTDALLTTLSDNDENVREVIAAIFGQQNEKKQDQTNMIDVLLTVISDPNADAIKMTAHALGQLSSNPDRATDKLLSEISNVTEARETAIETLCYLGQEYPNIINTLLNSISDATPSIRKCIVKALGMLGKGQPRVIDALLVALSDSYWIVRREAAKALGKLDNGQPHVIDALAPVLSDSWLVKKEAINALGQLSKGEPTTINGLLLALSGSDDDIREDALNALVQIGKRQPHIASLLLTALSNRDLTRKATDEERISLFSYFAHRVLGMLRNLNSDQSSTIDVAFAALSDPDHFVRGEASKMLGQLSKKQPHVLDRLITALSDSQPIVRRSAAEAFEQLSEGQPSVIDALLQTLSDSSTSVRMAVIRAFRQVGKGEPRVIDALLQAFADSDPDIRWQVVSALGERRDWQPRIVDALLQALSHDESGRVRQWAATAFQRLPNRQDKQSQITEVLFQAIFGISNLARTFAATAFGMHWDGQQDMIDTLLSLLSSSDISTRLAATIAFINFFPRLVIADAFINSPEKLSYIADALLLTLSDPCWRIRDGGVRALRSLIGKRLYTIANLLFDSSSSVRTSAASVLRYHSSGHSRIIDALLQALSDSDWSVRQQAAFSLANLQDELEGIGARLEDLLRQYEPIARRNPRGYNSLLFNALQEIAEKI